MALSIVPAIPASQIVNVIPSVLPAGGSALDLIGLILTDDTRVPIGDVISFVTGDDVDDYFGTLTQESALASIYFLGYDNSTAKPGKILFAQYNQTDVSAWLRGGRIADLTLAELQAITGSLTVTIDGTPNTDATVDLSAATSFSDAGVILATGLGILGVQTASVTASINDGSASVTGSISGNLMTVTAVTSGTLYPGSTVTGSGITAGTTILQQLTGSVGGTGTYQVSASMTVSSTTITASRVDGVMVVTAVGSGTPGVGNVLTGAGVTAGSYITAQLTGTTGSTGAYSVNEQQTVVSTTIVLNVPGVSYDSVLGAFVVNSGTTGAGSTIAFATGTAAAELLLTSATGATLSQGAAAAVPATFMDAVTAVTQNWVSFTTTFEPTDDIKIDFATWVNSGTLLNRFLYAMWDTSAVNTGTSGPTTAVGTITAGNYSGTAMIYEDPDIDTTSAELAAFLMGAIASLDFARTNGRATMAFRKQAGLLPQVSNGTVADNLIGYGLNFYGDYTTANDSFTWLYPGTISGDFQWIDSYVNQVWLNNALQLAMMVLLENVGSLPYNVSGYAMIEAACLDPINAAVNFGAIRPGITLSAAQIAEVNSAAGLKIDTTLSARGWYLQIRDATPQVRQARGSPPMTLWYMDGQSVQKLTLASILVQ